MYKIFFIILLSLFFSPFVLQAQSRTYDPLVDLKSSNIPGTDKLGNADFNEFIAGAFQFGVSIAIILAVIMVIWGGVEYMTSESPFMKGEGKTRIGAAIGGLILALSTIVIFNTIDPNIANKDFAIKNLVSELKVGIGEFDDGVVKKLVQDPNTKQWGYDTNGDNIPDDFSQNLDSVLQISNSSNSTASPTTAAEIQQVFGDSLRVGDIVKSTGNPKVLTDGVGLPPFTDATRQNTTAYLNGILNANLHHYTVVPVGSDIPLGTPVTVYNHTLNRKIRAFVGDRGPYGQTGSEFSLKAAYDLGIWTIGMGDAAREHRITTVFHLNQPKITASNVF